MLNQNKDLWENKKFCKFSILLGFIAFIIGLKGNNSFLGLGGLIYMITGIYKYYKKPNDYSHKDEIIEYNEF